MDAVFVLGLVLLLAAMVRMTVGCDALMGQRRAAPEVTHPLGGPTTYSVGLGANEGSRK